MVTNEYMVTATERILNSLYSCITLRKTIEQKKLFHDCCTFKDVQHCEKKPYKVKLCHLQVFHKYEALYEAHKAFIF